MNRANETTPPVPAAARKTARNSGDAVRAAGVVDEPIYKVKRMHTVETMFKRILVLAAGALLGVLCSLAAVNLAVAWNLWPNRELNRSADYMREVLQMVHENYVDPKPVNYDHLAKLAIHGMVETLDPHSEFLESKDNRELEEDLSGEFGGIGVQVETREGKVVVISPIAGTPGERAGILRGDEIVSIDGKVVGRDGPRDDVVNRLRGKPKTQVVLGLYRPSAQKKIELTLIREIIKVESVRDVRVIGDGVGYIQVTEFSEHTGEQFVKALNTLLRQGVDSLVIDLRNNPGGLLDAAVEVAEPFFRKNELIVYTQGRKPADRDEYRAATVGNPVALRLAVLINAGTASAAEVVTGALKDTSRAVVVGERSFGKGSVQSIFKLKNGEGLRLTTAHYYTPSGVTIHEKGITPQVEVVMTPAEDNKIARQRNRPDITDPVEMKQRFGFEPIEDRQLQAALDVLKGVRLLTAGPKPANTL
jgi:carboxyl-terminal processing protease